MKSFNTIIFAATVAADYGYGPASSSSSSTKLGYTTIYPGYGKEPVTVTAQYQPVPTYVDGKWSEYEAMSSVIDAYGKKITVTAGDQDLTIYSTKKTLTHTVTSTVMGGQAQPTGYGKPYGYSNTTYTTKVWYELYEELHECSFDHVGPHAIPGYPGNPKCKDNKDEQVMTIKKYSGGKWHKYVQTFYYGPPKTSVTTYDLPGTYTIPANDITYAHPTAVPAEGTYHAEANKPCTYGGVTTQVNKPTTITAAYPAYETHGAVTKTVIYSKTVTCDKPGVYTIVKPTVTVYPHATTVHYPTVTEYPAGTWHHPAETVTITKPGQAYTCSYEPERPHPTFGYPSYPSYPAHPTSKPTNTQPPKPDPSSDYYEPTEEYGHAEPAGYIKRGGVLSRRGAEAAAPKNAAKRVILV